MAGAAPLKPQSASGFLTGTKISATGTDFFIELTDGEVDAWSPLVDVTADGDSAPRWDNNSLVYSRVMLRGYLPAATLPSLANLITSSKNPVASFKCYHGQSVVYNATLYVERLRHSFRVSGHFVGVLVIGRSTGTSAASTQPSYATT